MTGSYPMLQIDELIPGGINSINHISQGSCVRVVTSWPRTVSSHKTFSLRGRSESGSSKGSAAATEGCTCTDGANWLSLWGCSRDGGRENGTMRGSRGSHDHIHSVTIQRKYINWWIESFTLKFPLPCWLLVLRWPLSVSEWEPWKALLWLLNGYYSNSGTLLWTAVLTVNQGHRRKKRKKSRT